MLSEGAAQVFVPKIARLVRGKTAQNSSLDWGRIMLCHCDNDDPEGCCIVLVISLFLCLILSCFTDEHKKMVELERRWPAIQRQMRANSAEIEREIPNEGKTEKEH